MINFLVLQRYTGGQFLLSPKKKETRDKIEEMHRKGNERRRKQLEKEYLDVKNLEIILIDFVPYERKEDMTTGLKELYEKEGKRQPYSIDEPRLFSIPDIKQSGIFSGGGTVNLGWILNSDLDWRPMIGVQKKLPQEFLGLRVTVDQFVDFSYYIIYSGIIKEKYQNDGIRKVFIESGDWVKYREKTPDGKEIRGSRPKGPKLEPTIRKYQKVLEDFLRPYSCGLFLNKSNKDVHLSCPSLKVVSVGKIDFDSFQDWERKHIDFLRFIGFDLSYSRLDNMLVGYYPERVFGEMSIFQGLVFLASTADFKGDGYHKPESEISDDVSLLTQHLAPLLHSIYWSSFALEIDRGKWKNELQSILREISASRKEKERTIQQTYDRVLESHRNFYEYFIEESRNHEEMTHNLAYFRQVVQGYTKPLNSRFSRSNFNLFEDLANYGVSVLKMEKEMLEHLKHRIDLIFSYSSSLTNMDISQTNIRLQKSMKWMTIVMLIFTIVTVILTIIAYGPGIWELIKQTFPQ